MYVDLQIPLADLSRNLLLAYQSFGVVYGDLSTSPLYVYKSIFVGKLSSHTNEDAIFGAFSLIFWTLTLIPLLKYTLILLSADDNGEGIFIHVFVNFFLDYRRNMHLFYQLYSITFRWNICSLLSALQTCKV